MCVGLKQDDHVNAGLCGAEMKTISKPHFESCPAECRYWTPFSAQPCWRVFVFCQDCGKE